MKNRDISKEKVTQKKKKKIPVVSIFNLTALILAWFPF